MKLILTTVAALALSGCSQWQRYNSTVGSRSIGAGGSYTPNTGSESVEVKYTVEYRK